MCLRTPPPCVPRVSQEDQPHADDDEDGAGPGAAGGPFAGLIFFRPYHIVVILVFGVLLGLAGSLVSVGRHLRNV